ncbi:MAG: putative lipopolysaccharide heptosyltransferase III [Verrucomicrobiota bacterium]
MKILFIKLKHIGDALILTPTLEAVKQTYPKAHITVLTRKSCEGILQGCSAIDRLVTSVPPEKNKRSLNDILGDFPMLLKLRQEHFDYVFELTHGDRGRWMALAINAHNTATYFHGHHILWNFNFNYLIPQTDSSLHSVLRDYQLVSSVLNLSNESDCIPALQFSSIACDYKEAVALKAQDNIVIHPATRWERKKWGEHKWIKLIEKLLNNNEKILLSSGPDEQEILLCHNIKENFSEHDPINYTGGKLTWQSLAGILYRAKGFIGVDTAAMHLAAACKTPTVALFLPWTIPKWHPWKVSHQCIFSNAHKTKDPSKFEQRDYATNAMQDIEVEAVYKAYLEIIANG